MNQTKPLELTFQEWFAKEYPLRSDASITEQVMNRCLEEVAHKAFYHGTVTGINLTSTKED